jgi:hypothetical protein
MNIAEMAVTVKSLEKLSRILRFCLGELITLEGFEW